MILFVAGCRPNFVKMAPLVRIFQKKKIPFLFCHTGQHKDVMMSEVFLQELKLPKPDFYGIENIPSGIEWMIVFGDVNGSRKAAEYAHQKGIKIIHIESGLRSFDLTMPEERNRIKIDSLSDILFVTEEQGMTNLYHEENIGNNYLVGNTMIDTLERVFPRFILLTLHRPSNVDNFEKLMLILEMLNELEIPVHFPKHPRLPMIDSNEKTKNIKVMRPLSYKKFIQEMRDCSLVITDSGGIQEEAVYIGKKILTLRENTERPITLKYGNELVSLYNLYKRADEILNIPLWDGRAAERIFEILKTKGIV